MNIHCNFPRYFRIVVLALRKETHTTSNAIIPRDTLEVSANPYKRSTDNRARMVCRHYSDVIMSAMASQVTSLTIVYSTIYSGADQRKHQSSASLAFVRGIHRGPVNSPHKWPVTRKMFPFDDVIMFPDCCVVTLQGNAYHIKCTNSTGYSWSQRQSIQT